MQLKRDLPLLLLTALALMAIALYNGFPLVEGDTGAYIELAINPRLVLDRTPFYALFLRITSMWSSLWFTVFAQCALLGWALLRFARLLLPATKPAPTALLAIIVAAITAFTTVGWVSAYLMPDVFTGILLIAIILLLTNPASGWRPQLAYSAVILLSLSVHNSHFLILAIFALLVMASAIARRQKTLVVRSAALLCLSAVIYLGVSGMNAVKKHEFAFSRGSNVFMMAKLAETGILHAYLHENCANRNYRICQFKHEIPATLNDFLWDQYSPLYRMGGWDSSKAEYAQIIHEVFTTPRYSSLFARRMATNTLKQMTQIQAPDKFTPQMEGAEPWKKVRQYFADEAREYNTSLQNRGKLSANAPNFVYYVFLALSSLWVLLFYSRVRTPTLHSAYGYIILFLIINALVASTFSTVIYRFQYRVFWLLPATNIIVIARYYWQALQTKTTLTNRQTHNAA